MFPVRARFLKKTATEFGRISQAVTRIALANAGVHFTLVHNGKSVLDLPPVEDVRERLAALFGRDLVDRLGHIHTVQGDVALDGFVARRFNLTTRVGKFIDPLADKLIMMTACVMLTLPIWGLTGSRAPLKGEIATIIIARDALICIYVLVSYLAGERGVFEPTKLGRATTFVQMFMIATTLVGTNIALVSGTTLATWLIARWVPLHWNESLCE